MPSRGASTAWPTTYARQDFKSILPAADLTPLTLPSPSLGERDVKGLSWGERDVEGLSNGEEGSEESFHCV